MIIGDEFIKNGIEAQNKIVDEFRQQYCEQCPGCGRRSSSIIGDACRDCYSSVPDANEKPDFEALCHRHALKMTDRNFYLKKRKKVLKMAAIAQYRYDKRSQSTPNEGRTRLSSRYFKRLDHLTLLDEIWNYLHPYPRDWVSGSFGKVFEVGAAAKAINDGNFDAFCDELHKKREIDV